LRYRHDLKNNKRIKTVELIIEETDLVPDHTIPPNKGMHIRIQYGEIQLATLVKQPGGKWNREKKYWELPYREVKSLGLEHRIINKNAYYQADNRSKNIPCNQTFLNSYC
jgi:hypothetical protein